MSSATQTVEGSLVRIESAQLSATRTEMLKSALNEATEQRMLVAQYVKSHMVEGSDYGVIPGTKNPTLLKPGAEKLADLFRCAQSYTLISSEEDFDRGFFHYKFRVRLKQRDSGEILAEGWGSCNSFEGRYRWRDGKRKCPKCQQPAISKSKEEYGGGWYCNARANGCNAKFSKGAPEIEKQDTGRVENDDLAAVANTVLKMAKKRCLVDGAIALGRCSDMFTQDLDDLVKKAEDANEKEQAEKAKSDESKPDKKEEKSKSAPAAATKPDQPTTATSAEVGPPVVPSTTGQSREERVRALRIWEKAKPALNGDGVAFKEWVFKLLGVNKPSSAWTGDDLSRLEAALPELCGEAPKKSP